MSLATFIHDLRLCITALFMKNYLQRFPSIYASQTSSTARSLDRKYQLPYGIWIPHG